MWESGKSLKGDIGQFWENCGVLGSVMNIWMCMGREKSD